MKKGFTLIELLVVIAIIGILATIVLVSLGEARNKARDAAIMADISGLRASGELYASNNNDSYLNFCTEAGGDYSRVKAGLPGGVLSDCGDSAVAWAACGQLVADSGKYFCSDSNGDARAITGTCNDTWNLTACP